MVQASRVSAGVPQRQQQNYWPLTGFLGPCVGQAFESTRSSPENSKAMPPTCQPTSGHPAPVFFPPLAAPLRWKVYQT